MLHPMPAYNDTSCGSTWTAARIIPTFAHNLWNFTTIWSNGVFVLLFAYVRVRG